MGKGARGPAQAQLSLLEAAVPARQAEQAIVPVLGEWRPERWPVSAGWQPLVRAFLQGSAGRHLGAYIEARLAAGAIVYPPQPLRALELTDLAEVRVVIIGQDPYHGPGQAEGLAFSVAPGVPQPPSLKNIFKELAREFPHRSTDYRTRPDGSLLGWARQGVLLINTSLTVEDGLPASHSGRGWEVLTGEIVKAVAEQTEGVVFLLWGAHAQARGAWLDRRRHLVLEANHPSPLSAMRPPVPFLGCDHFKRANAYLSARGQAVIDWH